MSPMLDLWHLPGTYMFSLCVMLTVRSFTEYRRAAAFFAVVALTVVVVGENIHKLLVVVAVVVVSLIVKSPEL